MYGNVEQYDEKIHKVKFEKLYENNKHKKDELDELEKKLSEIINHLEKRTSFVNKALSRQLQNRIRPEDTFYVYRKKDGSFGLELVSKLSKEQIEKFNAQKSNTQTVR